MSSTPALETVGLGKRYGHTWGLRDCSFDIPAGRIAALVGPNGSGKSTLLRMAAGITRPTTGLVRVFGHSPVEQTEEVLRRVGYLDQESPLYHSFKVGEMLRFGEKLNPNWDAASARQYLADLNISVESRIGHLSIGQQAQVALTMCLAKRPELLLLDEPVAALDPLAREALMQVLLGAVVQDGTTVLLSSHAIADLATVCDYLIILSASRVSLVDDLDYVLASHRLLVGARDRGPPAGADIIAATHSERQTDLLVRVEEPIGDGAWRVEEPTLEEIVIAYLKRADAGSVPSFEVAAVPPCPSEQRRASR
ncbi:MAG: ABC transporter ATP-binding protein [Acidimicrobiales bacterium]